MSMSVQDHLYAMPSKKGPQCGPVSESFPPPDHLYYRGMVDEEDSEQTLSAGEVEDVAESVHLCSSQISGSEKGSRLVCGGYSDQSGMPAYPHTGKGCTAWRLLLSGLQS